METVKEIIKNIFENQTLTNEVCDEILKIYLKDDEIFIDLPLQAEYLFEDEGDQSIFEDGLEEMLSSGYFDDLEEIKSGKNEK